jgi:hypothetical protein
VLFRSQQGAIGAGGTSSPSASDDELLRMYGGQ